MDIATLLGLVLAFGAILFGQHLEGGHLDSIMQPTAAIIVIGGTIGAVTTQFKMKQLIHALKSVKAVFFEKKLDGAAVTKEILALAGKARKEGIIALEKDLPSVKDPILNRALAMAIDGVNPKSLEESMETELAHIEEEGEYDVKVFEAVGGYAPTVGILGAVLGLIHVMQNLDDPSKLGAGIAVAFVATIYGVSLANLVALPVAGKLKLKLGARMATYELMLTGVLAIVAGENPRFIEERLKGYLDSKQRASLAAGKEKK